jgi:NAD-dependent dihydropyrimidine dehydrogenase PreA subunit
LSAIKIDLEKCDGCKTCVNACWVNVLKWDRAGKKPVVAYPEDCVHCNSCELACKTECIEVVPDFSSMYWPTI